MNTHAFARLLNTSSDLIATGSGRAEDLRALGKVLGQADQITLKEAAKRVSAHVSLEPQWPMPSSLLVKLTAIHDLLVDGDVKGVKDIGVFLSVLSGRPDGSVETFLAHLPYMLEAPATAVKKTERRAAVVDVAILQGYANRLAAAEADLARFKTVIAEILGRRDLKKKHYEAIAVRFLGYSRKFKSQKDITSALMDRQMQDAIQSSAIRSLSKIAV